MPPLKRSPPICRNGYGLVVAAGTGVTGRLTVVLLAISPHKSDAPHDLASQPAIAPAASTFQAVKPLASISAAALPSSVLSDATRAPVGQTAVPASANAGPYNVGGCQATGYSYTPPDAMIAAAQICPRADFFAGRSCSKPCATGQLPPSADREALLTLFIAAETQKAPGAAAGELTQLTGLRYLSDTDDTAVVGLIRRCPHGTFAHTTFTLTRTSGDRKLTAPPAGRWPAATANPASLTGPHHGQRNDV